MRKLAIGVVLVAGKKHINLNNHLGKLCLKMASNQYIGLSVYCIRNRTRIH